VVVRCVFAVMSLREYERRRDGSRRRSEFEKRFMDEPPSSSSS